MGGKVIFKITYNNECKRIPQEKQVTYDDIILRCMRGFSLASEASRAFTLEYEDPVSKVKSRVHNQLELDDLLTNVQINSTAGIKFTLID